nr:4Fe-4S dicluster domain-containing protein [Candidatus Sigynarchaeota archaeon]
MGFKLFIKIEISLGCIGCGNCVAVCPSEAIHLQKKDWETNPPQTLEGAIVFGISCQNASNPTWNG